MSEDTELFNIAGGNPDATFLVKIYKFFEIIEECTKKIKNAGCTILIYEDLSKQEEFYTAYFIFPIYDDSNYKELSKKDQNYFKDNYMKATNDKKNQNRNFNTLIKMESLTLEQVIYIFGLFFFKYTGFYNYKYTPNQTLRSSLPIIEDVHLKSRSSAGIPKVYLHLQSRIFSNREHKILEELERDRPEILTDKKILQIYKMSCSQIIESLSNGNYQHFYDEDYQSMPEERIETAESYLSGKEKPSSFLKRKKG